MRSSIRLSAATLALRSGIACCISTAHRTESTTLANSTSRPSPVVLTMRPWCSAIFGSSSSRRSALRRSCVPPRPPPSAANIPPHRRRGLQRDGGWWSFRLARRQTEARKIEFAMLAIAPMRGIRHHHGRKNSQLLDNCSRFVQSTQMRVTGGEKTTGRNPARLLLQRPEQHRPCFLEPPGKEVADADPHQRRRRRITRIETQRCFEMGDR